MKKIFSLIISSVLICSGINAMAESEPYLTIENGKIILTGNAKSNELISVFAFDDNIKNPSVQDLENADYIDILSADDNRIFKKEFSLNRGIKNIVVRTEKKDYYLSADSSLNGSVANGVTYALNEKELFVDNIILEDEDGYNVGALSDITDQNYGLPNVKYKLDNGLPITIGYIGGSITYGTGCPVDNWRTLTTDWFKSTYPDSDITEISIAVGGYNSSNHKYRADNLLFNRDIDLLFIEEATNDMINKEYRSDEDVLASMDGLVRRAYRKNPNTDIMFFYTSYIEDAKKYYGNNEMIPVVTLHQSIADYYKIPSANGGLELYNKYIENPDAVGTDGKTYFGDGYHPGKMGQRVYFDTLQAELSKMLSDEQEASKPINYVPKTKYIKSSYSKSDVIDMKTEIKYRDFKEADTANSLYAYYPNAMVNTKAGATMTFDFKGNSIYPIILNGSNTNGIMSIMIDGVMVNNNYTTGNSGYSGVRYGTYPTGIITAPSNGRDIHTAVITVLSEADTVVLGGFATDESLTDSTENITSCKANARLFMTNNTNKDTSCSIMFAFYNKETGKLKKITSFEQSLKSNTYQHEYNYTLDAYGCGQNLMLKCFLWKNPNSMIPLNSQIDINN